ncbi:hypothetical protein IWW37_004806 [Coemansia sp. RSA 2050]|nr:hypothetical protein IWW37_004806 [Coemansia sp. RSA 2050]KAJ2731105.1 hypothetical protein IW152_004768 [Coemansia sp. BCRC 34962]
MGNTQTKDASEHHAQGLGLHNFVLRHDIGRGAFGKVRLAEHVETRRSYALKYISKRLCAEKHSEGNILQERAILEEISHAYVASLRFSFQTTHYVFLVLDLMRGGDLRLHLRREKRFTESIVRLWVAELACALNYLHAIGVVHRDIKPENVLMDCEGHVALTDFNAAIRITRDAPLHCGVAGTTSYMAPELISGGQYAGSVDWWSLGILMYECVYGHRPFRRKNRDDLRRSIMEDDAVFPVTTDSRVSLDCISAIRGLLHKLPERRLGCGDDGFERLKGHAFFASIDWDALEGRRVAPLFVPETSEFDKSRVSSSPAVVGRGSEDTIGGGEGGVLDREFANFNYIEYLTFKAYVEQHGSVTAEAVSEAIGTASCGSAGVPHSLLQLRLDGRPLVRALPGAHMSSVSLVPSHGGSVRRRITGRAVARLKRMNPSMASLSHSLLSEQSSDDTLPRPATLLDTEMPPSDVPIDAAAWMAMLPSQRMLATRFCNKMTLDKVTASLINQPRAPIAEPPISQSASKPRSFSVITETPSLPDLQLRVNVMRGRIRHSPSMNGAGKDTTMPRLVPIAAQWKPPPTRDGRVERALVRKTNYPQLNSDPVIVAMAEEIAAEGWEVVPKSAALSGTPWRILSPKQSAFEKVAIL